MFLYQEMAETSLMFLYREHSKECGLSVETSYPRAEVQLNRLVRNPGDLDRNPGDWDCILGDWDCILGDWDCILGDLD